jgi:hypothetical protein
MRKIRDDRKDLNWVELLPVALRLLHNTPGKTGYSPHEILFGRTPLIPGIPLPMHQECVEATEFFEEQNRRGLEVKALLEKMHKKEMATLNSRRRNPPVFKVGCKVWVLRPRGLSADKLRSWWVGPCKVTRQIGETSYEVEVSSGKFTTLHVSQLKPHWDNEFSEEKLELFHFTPSKEEFDSTLDEWEVEKVIRHRVNARGKLEFLVQWKGFKEHTWEPLMNFIQRYNLDWREYVTKSKLKFDLGDYMLEHEKGGVSAILATLWRGW